MARTKAAFLMLMVACLFQEGLAAQLGMGWSWPAPPGAPPGFVPNPGRSDNVDPDLDNEQVDYISQVVALAQDLSDAHEGQGGEDPIDPDPLAQRALENISRRLVPPTVPPEGPPPRRLLRLRWDLHESNWAYTDWNYCEAGAGYVTADYIRDPNNPYNTILLRKEDMKEDGGGGATWCPDSLRLTGSLAKKVGLGSILIHEFQHCEGGPFSKDPGGNGPAPQPAPDQAKVIAKRHVDIVEHQVDWIERARTILVRRGSIRPPDPQHEDDLGDEDYQDISSLLNYIKAKVLGERLIPTLEELNC